MLPLHDATWKTPPSLEWVTDAIVLKCPHWQHSRPNRYKIGLVRIRARKWACDVLRWIQVPLKGDSGSDKNGLGTRLGQLRYNWKSTMEDFCFTNNLRVWFSFLFCISSTRYILFSFTKCYLYKFFLTAWNLVLIWWLSKHSKFRLKTC